MILNKQAGVEAAFKSVGCRLCLGELNTCNTVL